MRLHHSATRAGAEGVPNNGQIVFLALPRQPKVRKSKDQEERENATLSQCNSRATFKVHSLRDKITLRDCCRGSYHSDAWLRMAIQILAVAQGENFCTSLAVVAQDNVHGLTTDVDG
jgi:hypothetical protein